MTNRRIETDTIVMNVVVEGRGPAVLLCHGFPETSYAWRHQVKDLAKAGFTAIAPDLRGYGGTDQPVAVEEYTVMHIVGDMIALLDALKLQSALIVGTDWGSTIAWQAAQMRPDRFVGVTALGVPIMARPPAPPTSIFPQSDEALFYTIYFQEPGVAEAEFERDTRRTLRKLLFAASGDAGLRGPGHNTPNPFGMVSRHGGMLNALPEPPTLPAWLTEADLTVFTTAFLDSGFRGGLNYYRNLDRNWQLQESLSGKKVEVPALFIAGERDPGLQMPRMSEIIRDMPTLAPQVSNPLTIKGGGHWLTQEKPDQVSAALIDFAKGIFPAA